MENTNNKADVGQQLRDEKQLAELTLQQIIDHVPANIYWKNCDGVYLGCNQEILKHHNFTSPEQYIGKTISDLIASPFVSKHGAQEIDVADKDIMSSGIAKVLEEPAKATGQIFLSKKVPLKNNKNEVIGMLGVSIDITEKKKLEQLIKEKEQTVAKEKLQVAKMMAASIAHELRIPLATFGLIAHSLRQVFPALVDAYQQTGQAASTTIIPKNKLVAAQKQLDMFDNVLSEASVFIDMMLMKANVEEETNAKALTTLSIKDCVESALSVYPLTDRDKEIITFEDAGDFLFYGDKILFHHIIFNLLKNALYYVAASCKKTAGIRIELRRDEANGFNYLHFKDTGKGIAAEYLHTIFESFYSKTYHGTGVGLALCKNIMKEFGGDIQCQSALGEYAEFVLQFPLVQQTEGHNTCG